MKATIAKNQNNTFSFLSEMKRRKQLKIIISTSDDRPSLPMKATMTQ